MIVYRFLVLNIICRERPASTNSSFGTERVGSDSGGEGCSIFYLEVTGEAVLISKTEREETQFQSTFRSQIPSIQSARFPRLNSTSGLPKFLTNRDRVLSGILR